MDYAMLLTEMCFWIYTSYQQGSSSFGEEVDVYPLPNEGIPPLDFVSHRMIANSKELDSLRKTWQCAESDRCRQSG